jgi:hypothetical protein
MEYRYMPPVSRLTEEVHRSDSLGPVTMLSIREHRFPFLVKVGDWNRFNKYTGGTLVEKCCHCFDLMRHMLQSEPVRIYASAGVDHNHQEERYPDGTPDILDNAYVIVDFAGDQRALLELCMLAEGSRYQEEISVVGPRSKAECIVPGPGRFWPADLGEPPVPKVVISPRFPKGPRELDVPVDPGGSGGRRPQWFHALSAPEVQRPGTRRRPGGSESCGWTGSGADGSGGPRVGPYWLGRQPDGGSFCPAPAAQ